jgi:hypothetical protein
MLTRPAVPHDANSTRRPDDSTRPSPLGPAVTLWVGASGDRRRSDPGPGGGRAPSGRRTVRASITVRRAPPGPPSPCRPRQRPIPVRPLPRVARRRARGSGRAGLDRRSSACYWNWSNAQGFGHPQRVDMRPRLLVALTGHAGHRTLRLAQPLVEQHRANLRRLPSPGRDDGWGVVLSRVSHAVSACVGNAPVRGHPGRARSGEDLGLVARHVTGRGGDERRRGGVGVAGQSIGPWTAAGVAAPCLTATRTSAPDSSGRRWCEAGMR